MQFTKLICLGFSGSELEARLWKQVDTFAKCRLVLDSQDFIKDEQLQNTDALLVKLGAHIGREVMDKLPQLQYIGMFGTGYGGIDTSYAASKGIVVTNIADYATEAVAEFAFGILLEKLRDLTRAKDQARLGNYSDDFSGSEIRGKKFGIIGLGNIGRRTALLAKAFGADVCYWARSINQDIEANGIKYCELDQLLHQSDIISLNLALNDQTMGTLSAELVGLIKKNAVFINLSPMELLNFEALVKQLHKNDFTFILDHSDEMTEQQIKQISMCSSCIVYPPIGYLTKEASAYKKQVYVDNLKNYLAGVPSNQVN